MKKLGKLIVFILILVTIYIIVNIFLLIWHILLPDGFWGYLWYYTVCILVIGTIGTLLFINYGMMSDWKNKEVWLMIPILILIVIPSLFFELGPQLFLQKKLNDKYEYLKQSEKYIKEGKYKDALKYANKVYMKATNITVSPFFIMPFFYEKTNFAINKRRVNEYNATLNYALCYELTNINIDSAECYYNKSIVLAKLYYGDNSEYLLQPITGLIHINKSKKNIEKVESLYKELLLITNHLQELDDLNIVIYSLLSYASYSSFHGDTEKANYLRRRALDFYENSSKNKESFQYFSLLVTVAHDYINLNYYQQANELLEKANSFANNFEDDQVYVLYLVVKSRVLIAKSQTAKSDIKKKGIIDLVLDWYYDTEPSLQELNESIERLLLDLVHITKERQGENHPLYAIRLSDLALFYYRNNDFEKANGFIKKAYKLAYKYRSTNTDFYYSILLNTAFIEYISCDNKIVSLKKFDEFEKYQFDQINIKLPFLTEEEREQFLISNSKGFNLINSIYCEENDSISNCHLYNNMLAIKSIALQSNRQLREYLLKEANPEVIKEFKGLLLAKSQLHLTLLQNDLVTERIIDSLRQIEQQINKKIESDLDFNRVLVNSINWKSIQESIGDSDVVVSYIRVPSIKDSRVNSYYALIVTSISKYPQLVFISHEEKINAILNQEGSLISKTNKIYGKESRNELLNLVWDPIKLKISGYNKVYLTLDGVLNKVSFPGLLSGSIFDVVYITSPRIVVDYKNSRITKDNKTAILYGDINYSIKNSIQDEESQFINNSIRDRIISQNYLPLPYTKVEIDSINIVLKGVNYQTQIYTGINATEESFRNLSSKKIEIIHIATHGFYIPNEGVSDADLNSFSNGQSSVFNNVLKRTGLIFSGYLSENQSSDQDGILSSLEISKMNLYSTDLVVLSACETGLGEIIGGEGVFGLQRSFKIAGVNSIIMSLWSVPDKQTAMLMQKFYEYYTTGYSKQVSLRMAQEYIKLIYPEPFYWAAFIIID